MTPQANPTPNDAAHPNQSTHDAPRDEAVLAGGDVPIAVWRLDDHDHASATTPGNQLASRLAQQLVLVYTRHNESIVDLDNDPHLEQAAADALRRYIPIPDLAAIPDLGSFTESSGDAGLVLLRWPRHTANTPARTVDLFAACRLFMNAEGSTIVAVRSAPPGQSGTTYTEHLAELLPAARTAGLTHALDIVVVTGPSDGDEFLYYATPAEAQAARLSWPDSHDGQSYNVDLLVFTQRPA